MRSHIRENFPCAALEAVKKGDHKRKRPAWCDMSKRGQNLTVVMPLVAQQPSNMRKWNLPLIYVKRWGKLSMIAVNRGLGRKPKNEKMFSRPERIGRLFCCILITIVVTSPQGSRQKAAHISLEMRAEDLPRFNSHSVWPVKVEPNARRSEISKSKAPNSKYQAPEKFQITNLRIRVFDV